MAAILNIPQLRNKEWLNEEYCLKLRTYLDIANELGCTECTVKYWIHKHGLERRTPAQTHMLTREDDTFFVDETNLDVFNGSMLGDAGIELFRGKTLGRFSKRNIHYAHVLFVARVLFKKNYDKRILKVFSKLNGKIFSAYEFHSLGHLFLADLFKKWYPLVNGKRKKIVPRDLVLTSYMVLHWFLDDGYSRDDDRNGMVVIGFCSESFTRSDNDFLVEQLLLLGIVAKVVKYCYKDGRPKGTGWRIKISTAHSERFYKIIGPCPEELRECFGYKWKTARTYEISFPELRNYEWLYDKYVAQRMGTYRIAKLLGCDPALVAHWLSKHEMPKRAAKRGDYKSKFPQLHNREWLYDEYTNKRRTVAEIATEIGCSSHYVWRRLVRHGIATRAAKCRSSLDD